MHHVAIIGAGPIGLELAVALEQQGIDYVHFEARQIGQSISRWAPQTRWFSSNRRIVAALRGESIDLETPQPSSSES